MGALHPGHLSYIRRSKQANDTTVVSTFANTAQGTLDGPIIRNQTGNVDADGVRGLHYKDLKRMNSCHVERHARGAIRY